MDTSRKPPPWTNVYGVARSLLAAGTLLTLLAHSADSLFRPLGATVASRGELILAARIGLFAMVPAEQLELARWLAIAGLALVASGWRPRITGVLHWWLSMSFMTAAIVGDGGDQVTAVLALLLIPVTLTDPRRWHWMAAPPQGPRVRAEMARLLAASALVVIRVQVAVIYFQAGTAKMQVQEWANGTAVYYWSIQPVFGLSPLLRALAMPVLSHAMAVTLLTWGVMAFEVILGMAFFMAPRHRRRLLYAGLVFHAAIIVVHGLVSFFFAMAAALILYLRPLDATFGWPRRGSAPAAPPAPRAEPAAEPELAAV